MPESTPDAHRCFTEIVAALAGEPDVSLGAARKGFGAGTLQVGGKIFAMVSSDGAFVVKLPKARVEALEATGAGRRFDPGHGRLMKEWIAMDAATAGEWLALAREALAFGRGAKR
jgi:hypothetical protein